MERAFDHSNKCCDSPGISQKKANLVKDVDNFLPDSFVEIHAAVHVIAQEKQGLPSLLTDRPKKLKYIQETMVA